MPITTSNNKPDYAASEVRILDAMREVGKLVPPQRSFLGMRIIESEFAVERVEDWSACRSPARAKRRAKLGHPQRNRVQSKPAAYMLTEPQFGRLSPTGRTILKTFGAGKLVIHPSLVDELAKRIDRENDQRIAPLLAINPLTGDRP